MSLDMTVGTSSAASAAEPEVVVAAPVSRLWLYELMVAAAAAFGAVLASAAAVLLYLR